MHFAFNTKNEPNTIATPYLRSTNPIRITYEYNTHTKTLLILYAHNTHRVSIHRKHNTNTKRIDHGYSTTAIRIAYEDNTNTIRACEYNTHVIHTSYLDKPTTRPTEYGYTISTTRTHPNMKRNVSKVRKQNTYNVKPFMDTPLIQDGSTSNTIRMQYG